MTLIDRENKNDVFASLKCLFELVPILPLSCPEALVRLVEGYGMGEGGRQGLTSSIQRRTFCSLKDLTMKYLVSVEISIAGTRTQSKMKGETLLTISSEVKGGSEMDFLFDDIYTIIQSPNQLLRGKNNNTDMITNKYTQTHTPTYRTLVHLLKK